MVHHAIISLGILDETGVRRCIEPLVAFGPEAIDLLLQEVFQHLDNADFAPRVAFEQRVSAVECRVLSPGIETAVASMSQGGEFRLLLFEEVDHGAHRSAEIVEIKTVKTAHALIGPVLVVLPKPAYEAVKFLVAPHPGRKTLKCPELAFPTAPVPDISVDRRAVGPIAFDRDDVETVAFDQPFRNSGAGEVEFARPMASFAEADDAGIPETVEHRSECRIIDIGQRLGGVGDQFRERFKLRVSHPSSLLPQSVERT